VVRIRLSALKHGTTSSMIVLPNEDPAEWESFRKLTLEACARQGEGGHILAVSIAEHRWRIRRLSRVESWLLEQRRRWSRGRPKPEERLRCSRAFFHRPAGNRTGSASSLA
jgi:hypothetical protein